MTIPEMRSRDVLARAETMLGMYERRQTTAVPGTISLVRDLAAEVIALRTRAERAESTVAIIRRRAVEHPKGLSVRYVLAAIDTPDPEETPDA